MDIASPENAGAGAGPQVPEISRDEIKRRLNDPSLTLIDVLPREMFAAGHIPGALNLPLTELEQLAPQMLPRRDADIAAYCAKFT